MNIASVIQSIATLAWVGFLGILVTMVVRASRNQAAKGFGSLAVILLVTALLLTSVGAGLVFIQPEERGIVISAFAAKGYREQALQPGLRWIIPFAEQVRLYPISRQTYTMASSAGEGQVIGDDSIRARTKDGQEILIDASVIYSIDPEKIIELHINWQNRFQDELVRPASRNTIRDAVSQYNVEEIVSTRRVEMEDLITVTLAEAFADNDLILVSFLLRDIHFSEEYAAAVEQKQIAEQQAQQAKLVVEQRKQEAEQARQVAQGQADAAVIAAQGAAQARIIQAEAEAKANQLLAASLTPELMQYQYILKLAPGVQTIFLPSGNQFILPLPTTTTPTTP
ncbi:MAG: prohibitin family protein [Chloroflexi bacterium]|nr:prohibitin family protein [Chloroflexota bacterium]